MRFVASLIQDNWQKQLDVITSDRNIFTENYDIDPEFPLDEARHVTTRYIVSKKERAVRGIADDRLMKLVLRSQSKIVAFASCTHLLSQQAIRTLVVKSFAQLTAKTYLQLLLLAFHGNPNAVDELEYSRAKGILLALQHEPSSLFDGQYMRALVELSINKPVPKSSLVYVVLHNAIAEFCPKLSAELFEKKYDRNWHRCWTLISWISILQQEELQLPVDCLNPISILEQTHFPLRMWTAWQPLHCRVLPLKMTVEQRADVFEWLRFEGPDEMTNPKANYFERLVAENVAVLYDQVAVLGDIRLGLLGGTQDEARQRLRQFSECISYMVCQDNWHVELLLFLGLRKVISVGDQELMAALLEAKNISLGYLVLKLKKSESQWEQKLRYVQGIFSQLESHESVKVRTSAIGRYAASILMAELQITQGEYRSNVATGDLFSLKGVEIKLHQLMTQLQKLLADFTWISKMLSEPVQELLANCPTSQHLEATQQIRQDLEIMHDKSARSVGKKIESYMAHLFLERDSFDTESATIVSYLITLWSMDPPFMTKSLALLLADGKGKFRSHCIDQLQSLDAEHVSTLLEVMEGWNVESSRDEACATLADFLAAFAHEKKSTCDLQIVTVWKPVLYRMIKARGLALVDNAQNHMKSHQYIKLVRDIRVIFGDKVIWNAKLSPPILNPSIHEWTEYLSNYATVLERIDDRCLATRYILSGKDVWFLQGILNHLSSLEEVEEANNTLRDVVYAIARRLSSESCNAQDIYDVLCSVYEMTSEGAAVCSRILYLSEQGQDELASILLPVWLREPLLTDDDHIALRDVGRLLQIKFDVVTSEKNISALADYVDLRYQEILAEAKRLDYMRMDLKSRDRDGVVALLDEIVVEDTAAIEDAFARLPVPLLNVVEKIDDSQVEIIFPLEELTLLHKSALGVGSAQSLIVRLYIGDGSQPKFCIHLDNEASPSSSDIHSQWTVFASSRAPEQQICHGTITPVTYQLARVLTRYLVGGFKDLLSIHTLVTTSLKTMGSACIVCGKHHGVALRKATVCNGWECINIFARSPVEVRLAPIRQDPVAVDMLIRMIHSAIQAGHHNLLPDCPLDKDACLEIMRTLPSMETLSKSKYFSITIRNWHAGKTEQFLTWVCCSFQGFLSTATGKLRIPSLPPGTLQFVLANNAPLKEMSFHTEYNASLQQSKVVFHGTSIDRLYPILHQGLKIMSGTPLQAYGAASGPGIYLADEPSTSWIYADRKAATRKNWTRSAIKNGRILLGCELTGPNIAQGRGGIHVVQKESTVMVRYIFVVPTETTVLPIAGHLSSAMMSVFNSLRSGAL